MHWNYRRGIYSAKLMTDLAAEHGLSLDECLRGTGIDPTSLDDPEAEITGRQELALVTNIVVGLPDVPEIGLESGSRYHVTAYGIWGYAVMSSPTVRDAVALGLRYLHLTYAFSQFEVEEEGSRFSIILEDAEVPEPACRALIERDLSAVFHMWSQLLGDLAPLLGVELRFAEPAYSGRYEELLGVRPRFNAKRTALVHESALLDRPMPQANVHTAKLTEAQCEQLLRARRAREGISGRVRNILMSEPGRRPDMEAVAKELATTSRSLRRRLTEEGTSFRTLVDEVRETFAEQLLSTAGLNVDAVAERLGYADTAGFISAFKRWKGITPGTWRSRELRSLPRP